MSLQDYKCLTASLGFSLEETAVSPRWFQRILWIRNK
jgi:hypothetical protein